MIVLGAPPTAPDVLDQALLRPGRFDRRVVVQPPDRNGREAILQVHTRYVPLAPEIDLGQIASTTPGHGRRRSRATWSTRPRCSRPNAATPSVNQQDFTDALERIVLGAARSMMISDEDRRRTAYHEAGHAMVGMLTPGADPVRKVVDRPARPGTGRDVLGAGRGPVQLR